MTAFENGRMVAETLASGVTDFALTGFTPAAFNLAGKGMIKAIASRTREKRYYEGTELVVSNTGFSKGLQKFEDIVGRTVAIDALGSVAHYQLEQIARVKKVDIDRVTVKPVQTLDAIARAIGANEIDGAIMPASYARELLASNQAKLVGWYSELDEIQFGALFASSK
ncbi:MAG: ABC transporter substrate-binding protein, partial [Pseudolabrys sp.]